MDRRGFLRMIGLAPAAAAAIALPARAYAAGGLVQGPAGQALLGEVHTGEAIMPLARGLEPVNKLASGHWGLREVSGQTVYYGRLSVEDDDREANAALGVMNAEGMKPKVYLDGVEQGNACMADSEAGIVRRPLLSPSGHLIAHPGRDEVMLEEVRGEVVIEVTMPLAEPPTFPVRA